MCAVMVDDDTDQVAVPMAGPRGYGKVLYKREKDNRYSFADEAWVDRFWVTFSLPVEIMRSPDLPRIVAMFVESFVRFSDPPQAINIA